MNNSTFPHNYNINSWESYLKRHLTMKERNMFISVIGENSMNAKMKTISKYVTKKYGLEISYLSVLDGNCLFDSLSSLGIGKTHDELRKSISFLMYIFKTYPNFFENETGTLEDLFKEFNEVDTVICKEENKLYKYNYDVMCQDLYETNNWTRIPTQIIIMFISKLFNINFTIVTDTCYEHNIDMGDATARRLYLANISESHYLPLNIIKEQPLNLKYDKNKQKFFDWFSTINNNDD